jgi:hypothetical protein
MSGYRPNRLARWCCRPEAVLAVPLRRRLLRDADASGYLCPRVPVGIATTSGRHELPIDLVANARNLAERVDIGCRPSAHCGDHPASERKKLGVFPVGPRMHYGAP